MPPELTDDTTVVAAAEPVSTRVDGEGVILHPETGLYHGLNDLGTEIWDEIEEPITVAELTARIGRDRDVSTDRVRSDVESFLRDLYAADLIRVDA
jgi:hypothetical protein